MTRSRTLAALAAAAVLVVGSRATADTRRYAVVVAHTDDLGGKAQDLEYADDDGARYFELLSRLADDVRLYTVLDDDTQRLHPDAAAAARAPEKDRVLAGLRDVFERARRDADRGHRVEFTFVLAGHGDVGAGGEGYVSLLDAPFSRADLYQRVLAKSPATVNHVIVDACNSFFLVHRRGGDGDTTGPGRGRAVRAFLRQERLESYPNTGVLLSTSSEKESHEWSAYRAGVFSHQVRSALAGAADANGDGRVEYSEVEAYVASANARIDDPRARVQMYARAPAIDRARPLANLRDAHFEHWLELPGGDPLRVYLEDARGVRYLDAHLSGERDAVVGLVDSSHYYVRTADNRREARVELDSAGRIALDRGRLRSVELAARGAVADSFRLRLFAEPYGPSFYRGYISARERRPIRFGGERWRPERAPGPDCAGRVRQEATARGLAPGDSRPLDRALATLTAGIPDAERAQLCRRAVRAAETARIGPALIRRKLRRLDDRARADAELARRLRQIVPDVTSLVAAGRYESAARALSRASRE